MTWDKALKGAGVRSLKKAADWREDLSEQVLDKLGLERRSAISTIFGGLGFFALGILVGSALGVVFAPMAGSEIRTSFKQGGVKGVMDKTRTVTSTPGPTTSTPTPSA